MKVQLQIESSLAVCAVFLCITGASTERVVSVCTWRFMTSDVQYSFGNASEPFQEEAA